MYIYMNIYMPLSIKMIMYIYIYIHRCKQCLEEQAAQSEQRPSEVKPHSRRWHHHRLHEVVAEVHVGVGGVAQWR